MNASKSCPLVIFVKDVEKAVVASQDAVQVFRGKLENLPANVVIIGSHIQMDSRKEKVSIQLFSPPMFTLKYLSGLAGHIINNLAFSFSVAFQWASVNKVYRQSHCFVRPGVPGMQVSKFVASFVIFLNVMRIYFAFSFYFLFCFIWAYVV